MGKTKIEWCDYTINPVVGCSRGCPYCYAKKLNDRFKWVKDFSKQQYFPDRLKQIEKLKNKVVFINSMSDFLEYPLALSYNIARAIRKNPTNKYIFLSKNISPLGFFNDVPNVYIGYTITDQTYIKNFSLKNCYGIDINFNFLNIEPLLSEINFKALDISMLIKKMKWVIIGAETGNRKDKVIPKREWIENILRDLKEIGYKGKIFMKNNIKEIYPDIELIQEYPFERSK